MHALHRTRARTTSVGWRQRGLLPVPPAGEQAGGVGGRGRACNDRGALLAGQQEGQQLGEGGLQGGGHVGGEGAQRQAHQSAQQQQPALLHPAQQRTQHAHQPARVGRQEGRAAQQDCRAADLARHLDVLCQAPTTPTTSLFFSIPCVQCPMHTCLAARHCLLCHQEKEINETLGAAGIGRTPVDFSITARRCGKRPSRSGWGAGALRRAMSQRCRPSSSRLSSSGCGLN